MVSLIIIGIVGLCYFFFFLFPHVSLNFLMVAQVLLFIIFSSIIVFHLLEPHAFAMSDLTSFSGLFFIIINMGVLASLHAP